MQTMHHYLLKESHHALREQIRHFAETEIQPLAAELDEKATFSEYLTRRMGELGLFGMCIPETYGGRNLDTLSYIIAVEELARIDGSQAVTVAAHNSLGLGPIYHYGTEEQKKYFLPRLIDGSKLWAFGLTEPNAGSDAKNVSTRAEKNTDGWIINGEKIFITNSSSSLAAGMTLLACTGEQAGKKLYSTLLVESSTPGYKKEPILNKMMWRAADTGRVYFHNCKVPAENLLGQEGQGLRIMLETLGSGRLSIAAMGLGLAQGAYEMAVKYAKKRVQFGKTLITFQDISFKLAEMQVKIELARNTLYHACWLKDQGLPYGREAAIVKLYTSEIAKEIADQALQIHGAYGLIKSSDIERFYRDQRILQIGEGTSEILKLVISKYL
ncbi:MAG: acyl-CoA dehydrogenase family protein [Bacteroidales bacterium]|nr:acyl-CoA dehydrogenase family protein [Bacteroidales bacterium]